MSSEHERALAWARAQARAGRREIPLGSNRGPFVELCQHTTWLPGTGWPWCAAFFVAAWRYGAGRVLPYRGAGAYAWLEWAERVGWAVPLAQAVPGDGVVFGLGAGHIAILDEPYTGGVTVKTVDGNWSDRVEVVEHTAANVRGCVHVQEIGVRQPPRAQPRVFEVATSHNGHRQLVYVSGPRAIGRKLPELLDRFPRITITRRNHA